jgi:hypothetical protein
MVQNGSGVIRQKQFIVPCRNVVGGDEEMAMNAQAFADGQLNRTSFAQPRPCLVILPMNFLRAD